ncbi:MAG: M28 family peptidase, partial [Planctomycetes bacterium]|nr:M28 family peptidase [Planctomycetota bacterium]
MKEKNPGEKEVATARRRELFLVVGVGVACVANVLMSGCSAEKLVDNNVAGQSAESKSGSQRSNGRSVKPTVVRPVVRKMKGYHLDVRRVKGYLETICKIGRRPSGSKGMAEQQKLIADHFLKFGAKVHLQEFDGPHPLTGEPVRFGNLIVTWNPQAKKRVLLSCHYDTRPYPDRDLRRPHGKFVGANDGASGVALFMELAHHLADWPTRSGVDLVLFDGEELVFQERGEYFLGSTHFARQYRRERPPYRYTLGIVVDMIADVDLDNGEIDIRQALQRIDGRFQLVEPKTSSSMRTIAIPNIALDALRRHRTRQLEESLRLGRAWKNDMNLVFCTTIGTPLDKGNVTKREFRPLLKHAGLDTRLRFHDLRHSCASYLAQRGCSLLEIGQVLNHKTASMTFRYSHLQKDHARKILGNMTASIFGEAYTNGGTRH